MQSLDEMAQQQEVKIYIQIDVGDERIYDSSETGTGQFPAHVIDSAIEQLGKAERHWIPAAIQKEYDYQTELEASDE